jgi:hypothetical protein
MDVGDGRRQLRRQDHAANLAVADHRPGRSFVSSREPILDELEDVLRREIIGLARHSLLNPKPHARYGVQRKR